MSFADVQFEPLFDDLDDMGYTPTMEQRKMMLGSFEKFEEKEAKEQCLRPKVYILRWITLAGETMYVIRLTQPQRNDTQWFLKSYGQFTILQVNLKAAIEKRGWGDYGAITHVPELPADGTFGIRRRLSAMGLNDFLDKQKEGLQLFMNELMVQVPDISAELLIQQFFSPASTQEGHQDLIDEAIVEASADVTLPALKGYWKLRGSMHVWSLAENGQAQLNGKYRGPDYDIKETGDGVQRNIYRADGWYVDLQRSSANAMIWTKPGQADLEWVRDKPEHAEALLKKYATKRAELEAKKAKAEKMTTIDEKAGGEAATS